MSNRFVDAYDREHGYTVLTDDERATVHNAIYFGHTKDEIMTFARRHGTSLAKSWSKGDMADAVVSELRKRGMEHETMLSMVSTPSSYLGGD